MRFADFEIDPAACELRRDGVRLPLGPQPVRLLMFLVERAGVLVTREELYEAFWANADVDVDRALNTCIRQLRSALGERVGAGAGAERFIHTYPRRGYRFTFPSEAEKPAQIGTPGASKGQIFLVAALLLALLGMAGYVFLERGDMAPPRVVVFPFRSLATNPDELGAAGFTETVLTTLAVIEPTRLQVLGWTPNRDQQDSTPVEYARRTFDADFVLLGTYQPNTEGVTINVRLVNAESGEVVWAKHLSREEWSGAAPMELAAGIARSLLGTIPERLSTRPTERGPSPAARLDYLEGAYLLHHPDITRRSEAIPYLERAIVRDSLYAPAHARLAEAMFWGQRFDEARASADRALSLDPDQPDALFMRGNLRLIAQWDWSGAEKDIQAAIRLVPGHPAYHQGYAFLLSTSGRHAEAIKELELARELDPVSPEVSGDLGLIYYWAGDYRAAADICVRTVTLEPAASHGYACAFSAFVALEEWSNALAQARKIVLSTGSEPDSVLGSDSADAIGAIRKFREWRVGLLERAVRGGDVSSLYWLAIALADLGRTDEALDALERAAAHRSLGLVTVRIDPRLSALRGDPRFEAVVRTLTQGA